MVVGKILRNWAPTRVVFSPLLLVAGLSSNVDVYYMDAVEPSRNVSILKSIQQKVNEVLERFEVPIKTGKRVKAVKLWLDLLRIGNLVMYHRTRNGLLVLQPTVWTLVDKPLLRRVPPNVVFEVNSDALLIRKGKIIEVCANEKYVRQDEAEGRLLYGLGQSKKCGHGEISVKAEVVHLASSIVLSRIIRRDITVPPNYGYVVDLLMPRQLKQQPTQINNMYVIPFIELFSKTIVIKAERGAEFVTKVYGYHAPDISQLVRYGYIIYVTPKNQMEISVNGTTTTISLP